MTDIGTLTINVTAVNDAPVAVDDSVTATEDTLFNSVIDLDANDTDLDGDALSVVAGTFATTQGGSITIAADGSYTYTPAANFNGVDSVDYTVTDGEFTDVGTLTINVTAVNDAPVAVDDSVTATEDTPFNSVIDLDANDTDLDGDALSVVAGTFVTTQGGSITTAADGSYTYTPAANFNGVDSVDYTVTDGALTDVGTLTINVTAVNDAPVAVDDSVIATEDTSFNSVIDLDANDTDLDGDALSVVAGTFVTTQGGSITIAADGSYTYTPAANFNGVDSVDYTVTDGALTDVGTLTINVTPVNDVTVAVDDGYTTLEDTPLVVVAIDGILANDTDPDGNPLQAQLITNVTDGTLALNADGSFTYTPDLNFAGTDSFTYQAGDGSIDSNIATVILTVTPVNDAPVAVDDGYTTLEDTRLVVLTDGILANDTDPDGNPLQVQLIVDVHHGTLVLNADGVFLYIPDLNFTGTDFFTYQAGDGSIDSNIATVRLTVTPVNDVTVAADDGYTTLEDTPLVVVAAAGILANDTDPDGNPLQALLITNVTDGTLALNADGSFTYTPDPNFAGTDSFTYQAGDGSIDSNIATVTFTVTPVNDAPVAADDGYTTPEDTPLVAVAATGILANDTDPDLDPLTGAIDHRRHRRYPGAECRRFVHLYPGLQLRRHGHFHLPGRRRLDRLQHRHRHVHRDPGQ